MWSDVIDGQWKYTVSFFLFTGPIVLRYGVREWRRSHVPDSEGSQIYRAES